MILKQIESPRPVPTPTPFVREAGIENACQVFGGDADAGVGNLNTHYITLAAGPNCNFAVFLNGLRSIDE